MIGNIQDVLLALVNGSDTVNEWRNKTNAIIDFLNKKPLVSMPAILFSDAPPVDDTFMLWFDTKSMTLMTRFAETWVQFHQVYSYEVKFYQKVISADKIVPVGFNGLAVSPTIADGVVVKIENGSVLKVV